MPFGSFDLLLMQHDKYRRPSEFELYFHVGGFMFHE